MPSNIVLTDASTFFTLKDIVVKEMNTGVLENDVELRPLLIVLLKFTSYEVALLLASFTTTWFHMYGREQLSDKISVTKVDFNDFTHPTSNIANRSATN